jgi:hypothetical protein
MMNQVEKEKHREIFCKFADQVSFLMIENLPRKESARLLINAIELYQHRHPINNALIPGKQTVREQTSKRYDEMNKIFRRLREDLRIALCQKELELEMREN